MRADRRGRRPRGRRRTHPRRRRRPRLPAVSDVDAPPEIDRVADAPHPRSAARLFGQAAAEAAFLESWASGKLPHAWLLRGPRGVGKATLAYRIARALLADPAPRETLDLDPAHPVARRVAAGSEPGLYVLRRPWDAKKKRHATVITAEAARAMERDFFRLTAADGGWRVAVVDAADDLNAESANALLKVIEEPPPQALILLVAHAAAAVLPTIRSRCRTLTLGPLAEPDFARALETAGAPAAEPAGLAALSGAAPGEALRLLADDGPALYADLVALAATAPGLDRRALMRLADGLGGRAGATRFDLALRLTATLLQRLARAAALGPQPEAAPGEAAATLRLAPDAAAARRWAEAAARVEDAAARARAVNLDPAQTILDIWLEIDATAAAAR
ncbi:MAG: DNA polymerase III subunit delta' [Rhodobacteraceae bacterium]|nr:MAG: DNA polymerase III subunit delta' [Paracoccaceae bacterium]